MVCPGIRIYSMISLGPLFSQSVHRDVFCLDTQIFPSGPAVVIVVLHHVIRLCGILHEPSLREAVACILINAILESLSGIESRVQPSHMSRWCILRLSHAQSVWKGSVEIAIVNH